MPELDLPPDLKGFLQSGNQLQYDASQSEAGQVGLHTLPELSLANLLVNTCLIPNSRYVDVLTSHVMMRPAPVGPGLPGRWSG
jgi:hypothetical protein